MENKLIPTKCNNCKLLFALVRKRDTNIFVGVVVVVVVCHKRTIKAIDCYCLTKAKDTESTSTEYV